MFYLVNKETKKLLFEAENKEATLSGFLSVHENDFDCVQLSENDLEIAYNGEKYLKGFAPEQPISEIAQKVRSKRDQLLTASDWTQMPDCPLNAEAKTVWVAYRQALRDVPLQNGFPNEIVWPSAPGGAA